MMKKPTASTGPQRTLRFKFPPKNFFALALIIFSAAGCLTVRLPKIEIKTGSQEKYWEWRDLAFETLQNNPDLKAARFAISSSARSRDIAAGNYLPSVTGTFDRDRSAPAGPNPMKDNMRFGISGDQPLFTGFDTTGKFLKSRKDLEASRLAYEELSASTRFQLRSVYAELLRLEKYLTVSRAIAQRRSQNAELIRLRYDAGRENLGSSMRAAAIAEQAFFTIRQTERRTESQSLLLGRLLGGEFMSPMRVAGDLEKMTPVIQDSMPDYSGLAEKTPHVRKLLKTAESFKAAVVSAQAAVWPTVDGTLDYGNTGGHLSTMKDDFTFGFKVSLPLFNGGKNIEGILKAKADYQSARQSAESAHQAAVAQMAEAWTLLRDAAENVLVRKKFLEASRKRAEIVRSEYTSGLVSFQDFDIAEQDLADSETSYVQALADVLIKEANWASVKGLTLEDTLNEAQ